MLAMLIAVFGWSMPAVGWGLAGAVWGYALAWFFINEEGRHRLVGKPHQPQAVEPIHADLKGHGRGACR